MDTSRAAPRQAEAERSTDYLTEVQGMIECWDLHRSGDLEAFAERLVTLGDALTYRTYSEARVDFLREHLELVTDVRQRPGALRRRRARAAGPSGLHFCWGGRDV